MALTTTWTKCKSLPCLLLTESKELLSCPRLIAYIHHWRNGYIPSRVNNCKATLLSTKTESSQAAPEFLVYNALVKNLCSHSGSRGSEFKVSLVYRVSSMMAGATQKRPWLENKQRRSKTKTPSALTGHISLLWFGTIYSLPISSLRMPLFLPTKLLSLPSWPPRRPWLLVWFFEFISPTVIIESTEHQLAFPEDLMSLMQTLDFTEFFYIFILGKSPKNFLVTLIYQATTTLSHSYIWSLSGNAQGTTPEKIGIIFKPEWLQDPSWPLSLHSSPPPEGGGGTQAGAGTRVFLMWGYPASFWICSLALEVYSPKMT